jgi:hypothetical protein
MDGSLSYDVGRMDYGLPCKGRWMSSSLAWWFVLVPAGLPTVHQFSVTPMALPEPPFTFARLTYLSVSEDPTVCQESLFASLHRGFVQEQS